MIRLIVLCLVFVMIACDDMAKQPKKASASVAVFPNRLEEATPQETAEIHNAFNEVGFQIIKKLYAEKSENIFISPTSITLALAMTYNGAQGKTKDGMAKTLGITGIDDTALNQACNYTLRYFSTIDESTRLNIANSIWARAGKEFHQQFLDTNQEYFQAKIASIDFDSPTASKTINKWVEEATNNKIRNMVPETIDSDTIMFLINAIYFKGSWQKKFDPRNTSAQDFHLLSGKKTVQMMSQNEEFPYMENENFQAVSLPYGKEGKLSMYIFLPTTDSNLQTFLDSLTNANWQQWRNSFYSKEGNISLPSFKVEYEVSLNKTLIEMGMSEAFSAQLADFSGMRPIPPTVFIKNVKHKSFVEVNEEGTEAAAATSIEMGIESARVPFEMKVDRPFFFLIADHSGNVIFAGTVLDPK